jgi:hypothetical protein
VPESVLREYRTQVIAEDMKLFHWLTRREAGADAAPAEKKD